MINLLMLVELGLIRAGRKSLTQRYTEAVRRLPMASGDDIEARVRALIVVGPGEEDEAADAYADLDDATEGWYDKADWINMEERG